MAEPNPSELALVEQPQSPQEPWTQENPAASAPRSVAFHVYPQDMIEQARASHQYLRDHLPLVERAVQVGEANQAEIKKMASAAEKMAEDAVKPVPRAVYTNAELAAGFLTAMAGTEAAASMTPAALAARARSLVAEFRKFYPINSY